MSLNPSEERLGALARKTFLSMWSYENPFYEQGKELCDLLVVFGDDVIVISDKLNAFGTHQDNEVNWNRWYKKAVAGSVRQLCGARNHIKRAPDAIYTNAQVSSPLPLRLPSIDRMRIHLIAVANGCQDACLQTSGRPSLRIDTRHSDSREAFSVGTVTKDGDFVHIISTPALDAMFHCFDTARDFLDYLERKKEALLREDWLIDGEENLVAAYMMSQPGNGPFFIPLAKFPVESGARIVRDGEWSVYLASSAQEYRQQSRQLSYVIDRIIEDVANEYANERMVIGQDQGISYHEQGFRLLASESRLSRQLLGKAFYDIYQESTKTFWSTVLASVDSPRVYYVWLLYPEPPAELGVEDFEMYLLNELSKYMMVARAKFPQAERVFGICLPNRDCTSTSNIYQVMNGEDWTDEMQVEAEFLERNSGILGGIEQVTVTASR